MSNYGPIIGLEIHVELKTLSKMFCQCSAEYFGKKPNTNTCPVCLGLPGALPVPNRKAVEWTIKMGKALNCRINNVTKFDRKHYSYPDLPKGYQISQYEEPIATSGWLNVKYQMSNLKTSETDSKKFNIRRVHLEEDTGKLIHAGSDTLVDFNRSGVPLVEIVTEPDFDNADDVKIFLEELHTIIRYLDISDADMEKGTMRIEPNISIEHETCNMKHGEDLPPYKVEIKNINSFSFVKKGIEYELERQLELLNSGVIPEQETRGYDEKKGITYSQRSKEEAHDYRYFPEPDIPPMVFEQKYIDSITVPELPSQKIKKYTELGVNPRTAFTLTRSREGAVAYESFISDKTLSALPNINVGTANLIVNKKIDLNESFEINKNRIIQFFSPKNTNMEELNAFIAKIIKENTKVVEDYKKGKTPAIMFLVGQVMKEMKGKADAKAVKEKLEEKLKV